MTQVCISVIVGVFFNTLQLQNTTVNSLIATTLKITVLFLSQILFKKLSRERPLLKFRIDRDHFLDKNFYCHIFFYFLFHVSDHPA